MPTGEYFKQKITCVCGSVIGKYKYKYHLLTWEHHYIMGTLDAYYQQQKNITNKHESS